MDSLTLHLVHRDGIAPGSIAKELGDDLVAIVFDGDADDYVDVQPGYYEAALRNLSVWPIDEVDVMRVNDDCFLFIFQDDQPDLASRMLDVSSLMKMIESKLPTDAARAAASIGAHGVLAGVPRDHLLIVFVIDGGDLATGAENVIANVLENYEEDDDESLSPWIYWVRGDHVEEIGYELDAEGEVESIHCPHELLPLLR